MIETTVEPDYKAMLQEVLLILTRYNRNRQRAESELYSWLVHHEYMDDWKSLLNEAYDNTRPRKKKP